MSFSSAASGGSNGSRVPFGSAANGLGSSKIDRPCKHFAAGKMHMGRQVQV